MKTPKTIRIVDYTEGYKDIHEVDALTYKDKDSFGYETPLPNSDMTYKVSLASTFARATKNVTFLISQVILFAPWKLVNRALADAGIWMPPEYDWSFIRDAEPDAKMAMAKVLLISPDVRKRLQNLFAGQIAKNLGLMS